MVKFVSDANDGINGVSKWPVGFLFLKITPAYGATYFKQPSAENIRAEIL